MWEKRANGVSHVCILLSSSAQVFLNGLLVERCGKTIQKQREGWIICCRAVAGMHKQLGEESIFLTLHSLRSIISLS